MLCRLNKCKSRDVVFVAPGAKQSRASIRAHGHGDKWHAPVHVPVHSCLSIDLCIAFKEKGLTGLSILAGYE